MGAARFWSSTEITTLKNDKALITGCLGSVGTYMGEWLAREHPEIEVHGVGRASRGLFDAGAVRPRTHIMDLRSRASVESLIADESFDVIFHFASDADVAGSFEHPVQVLDNNILSTAVLFEAVRRV